MINAEKILSIQHRLIDQMGLLEWANADSQVVVGYVAGINAATDEFLSLLAAEDGLRGEG